jgi:hypothetical protein
VNRLFEDLVQRLPAASILAVESRRALDTDLLPDVDAWDVRRYGGTQIALRTLPRNEARGAGPSGSESADVGP